MRLIQLTGASEYDVIVVGGGNAGLCAALTAVENVERVLLLERAPFEFRGGNSKYTRDIRYAHEKDTFTTGPYSEEEFLNDILKVTHQETNIELARLVVRESRNVPEWMKRRGIKWQRPLRGTLHLGRTNLFFLGGGKALVNVYYETARKRGLQVAYNAMVEDLIVEDGQCVGVIANIEGRRLELRSRSVILTAGGFESNLSWLKEYWGDAVDQFVIRGTKFNDGRLLRCALEKGAASIGDPKGAHMIAVDARSPKYDGGIVTRVDSIPLGIVVNGSGKRFYDEGEDEWSKRYAIWGRLIAEQPNQIAYSIFDSKARGKFIPAMYEPYSANSIEQLADILKLNPSTLAATVKEFNNAISGRGKFDLASLDDCSTNGLTPPKSHWALPIDTSPFFSYVLRPGVTFTYMGLSSDQRARVIRRDGTPLKNLYAAGEIMSGNILSRGYLGGFGLTIGTVFGRIAGEEATR